MLDLPDVVEAGPVGELDLLEGVGQQRVLRFRSPRPGQLVLVEDAEPHVALSSLTRMPRPRGRSPWPRPRFQGTAWPGRARIAPPPRRPRAATPPDHRPPYSL